MRILFDTLCDTRVAPFSTSLLIDNIFSFNQVEECWSFRITSWNEERIRSSEDSTDYSRHVFSHSIGLKQ